VITLIITLAAVAAYLFVGWYLVAPRYVTREMARNFERWAILADRPDEVAGWRRFAAGEGAGLGLIWPAYLAARLVTGSIASRAPLCDQEARRKIAERDRRIADLERQLGIKP
jgi:hypothetical protein